DPDQFMQEVDSIMQRWDFTGTHEMWMADGRLIERFTAPVKDQAGNNLGRLWVFHDVTLQYQAERALETQLLHVSSLYALSRELTAKPSLEELYQVLFESVSQRLNLDSFFIHLYHPDSEEVETVMLVDRVDEAFRRFEPGKKIPLSQSFCEPVVHQKKPILLNRPEPKAHEPLLQPFGNVKRRSRSLMFVPMLDAERVIGVLSAQSYTPDVFSENELQFFAGIANQAALALSNAHLIEELRHKNDELVRMTEQALKAKGNPD
ncbi:MAG: GAF domain-containing protein, partial [bacterium]